MQVTKANDVIQSALGDLTNLMSKLRATLPIEPDPPEPVNKLRVYAGADRTVPISTLNFNAVINGGQSPYKIRWFLNNLESVGMVASRTFTKLGTYVGMVEVVDNAGNRATDDITVRVVN